RLRGVAERSADRATGRRDVGRLPVHRHRRAGGRGVREKLGRKENEDAGEPRSDRAHERRLYHGRVSTRFGRYDLLRPIGKGGMAEAFLARYAGPEGFEKQLVIKRVLPRISDSQHLLRMFFEEAKTQVSFSQSNLVSVFDFGRVDNEYFIAMDYVRGADLASLFAAERAAGRRLAPSLLAH